MVVTSVVTYTFPIGPFLGAPSSRYGPSVDWGVHPALMKYSIWGPVDIAKCTCNFVHLSFLDENRRFGDESFN